MGLKNFTSEIKDIGEGILKIETIKYLDKASCSFKTSTELHIILYFILLLLLLLVILKYKKFFMHLIRWNQARRGFVHIMYRLPNKRIVDKFKELDKYNNFKIKNCLHSLDKMHDYIFGFDKKNFPVFLYDKHFILPLKLDTKTINEELKSDYKIETGEDLTKTELQVLKLKIDSSVLETVYDRKIIQDLYKEPLDKTYLFIVLGVVIAIIIIVLIVTGQWKELMPFFTGQ